MSDPISVNVNVVRSYNEHLGAYAQFLHESFSGLGMEIDRLSQTWDDPGFEVFRNSFRSTQSMLESYVEEIVNVRPKLEEYAGKVETYDRFQVEGR